MSKDTIKGGKADKMSVSDIAKLHGVSSEAIEKEIEIGMKIESEHTSSKEKQREIAMDHLVEDPKYYSDPKTGLIAKEKESERHREKMNEEANKMMALAGIQESDKKFLANESFSENTKESLKESMGDITPEVWAQMHPDSDFIEIKFSQEEVEPGEDDDTLYKLG